MSNVRYFGGGRDPGKRSAASELMRIEIQKKGKLPSADRFKYLFKQKLQENRDKALGGKKTGFQLPGSLKEARQMSKRAEQALKEMSQKKAAKEAKAMRRMVVVQPKNYYNGNLNKKGKIFDIAGNMIGEVNVKNGNMSTVLGWSLGKYKPKSFMTDMAIQDAINKYSPYYINQRRLQALAAQQAATPDVINIHGRGFATSAPESTSESTYGSDFLGPRQNVGVTSWGARSDNVWGTYSDNAWGNSMDNVWGGNMSDVWGGIGVGGLWGSKGYRIFGTGNGVNHLKAITSHILALFGVSLKQNRERLVALHEMSRNSGSAHEHAQTARTGAAHEHAQTTRAPTTRK